MLYPEIIHMTVWDHTTSKEKPRSGVGGDQRPGVKEQHPPCKNKRYDGIIFNFCFFKKANCGFLLTETMVLIARLNNVLY